MTKLVVDGDIYAFQYAAAHSEYIEIDGWLRPRWDMRAMKAQWEHWVEEKLPRHADLIVCFSDSTNFRKSVDSTYKAKRTSPKPEMYKPLVDWIKAEYKTEVWPTLEADDVLGILATSLGYTMVSDDKDLNTIPGNHWDVGNQRFYQVTPEEADRFWMAQTLTGDPTDGYPGCPGVGAVGAAKLLAPAKDLGAMWDAVLGAYCYKGLTEEDAIKQARLSRILRHGDYDTVNKEVKLWNPSTK